jgi:hypothetical protein
MNRTINSQASFWFLLRVLIFGTIWTMGFKYAGNDSSWSIKYRGKWYLVTLNEPEDE